MILLSTERMSNTHALNLFGEKETHVCLFFLSIIDTEMAQEA